LVEVHPSHPPSESATGAITAPPSSALLGCPSHHNQQQQQQQQQPSLRDARVDLSTLSTPRQTPLI